MGRGKAMRTASVDMRGKDLSEKGKALNAAIVGDYMRAQEKLDEGLAFALLCDMVGPDAPEANRWAFGAWIKLACLCTDTLLQSRDEKQETLFAHLQKYGPFPAPTLAQLYLGLGANGKQNPDFWEDAGRVRAALAFLGLSARHALGMMYMMPWDSMTPLTEPDVPRDVLLFLGSLWAPHENTHHVNTRELAILGAWVTEVRKAKKLKSYQLAEALLPCGKWSNANTARAMISRTWVGRDNIWRVRTFPILAAFLGYTPEGAVEAYTAWKAQHEGEGGA